MKVKRRPALEILAVLAFVAIVLIWSLIAIHYLFEWWIGR